MIVLIRIIKYIVLAVLMFIGSVVLMKLVAEAFARLVLWTGDIWGMGYR